MKLRNVRLQFITHYTERYSYIDSARIALEGGCRWIQLRMKDADETLLEETALIVQKMCKEYDATFIIDDNVHLCKKIKADGVHLGKNDMPIAEARKILGDDFIIGATVNTFDDVLLCQQSTVNGQQTLSPFPSPAPVPNYFGCGPFRFTSTKKNLAPILGLDGYREIMKKMKENNIDIPLVAIGGITKDDVPELMKTGIDGIAISGSVLRAENPVETMYNLQLTVNSCLDALIIPMKINNN